MCVFSGGTEPRPRPGFFARLLADRDGVPSSMRLLVGLVILNELVMRWYVVLAFRQPTISTWNDIAALAVPFFAKAMQSAFERPWGAPGYGGLPYPSQPGGVPGPTTPDDGGNLGGGDL